MPKTKKMQTAFEEFIYESYTKIGVELTEIELEFCEFAFRAGQDSVKAAILPLIKGAKP